MLSNLLLEKFPDWELNQREGNLTEDSGSVSAIKSFDSFLWHCFPKIKPRRVTGCLGSLLDNLHRNPDKTCGNFSNRSSQHDWWVRIWRKNILNSFVDHKKDGCWRQWPYQCRAQPGIYSIEASWPSQSCLRLKSCLNSVQRKEYTVDCDTGCPSRL